MQEHLARYNSGCLLIVDPWCSVQISPSLSLRARMAIVRDTIEEVTLG